MNGTAKLAKGSRQIRIISDSATAISASRTTYARMA